MKRVGEFAGVGQVQGDMSGWLSADWWCQLHTKILAPASWVRRKGLHWWYTMVVLMVLIVTLSGRIESRTAISTLSQFPSRAGQTTRMILPTGVSPCWTLLTRDSPRQSNRSWWLQHWCWCARSRWPFRSWESWALRPWARLAWQQDVGYRSASLLRNTYS